MIAILVVAQNDEGNSVLVNHLDNWFIFIAIEIVSACHLRDIFIAELSRAKRAAEHHG